MGRINAVLTQYSKYIFFLIKAYEAQLVRSALRRTKQSAERSTPFFT